LINLCKKYKGITIISIYKHLCTNYDLHRHEVQSFESPIFHRNVIEMFAQLKFTCVILQPQQETTKPKYLST